MKKLSNTEARLKKNLAYKEYVVQDRGKRVRDRENLKFPLNFTGN